MAKKRNGNGYGSGTWMETGMILSTAFLALGVKGSTPIVSHASPKILAMLLAKRQFGTAPDRKGSKQPRTRTDGNRLTLIYAEVEARINTATGRPIISRKSMTRGQNPNPDPKKTWENRGKTTAARFRPSHPDEQM